MNIRDDFILKNIHKGYLVGGYIRDLLMNDKNISPKDRDIAIKGAESFAKQLSEELDATFIILDSENKIFRLVLKDKENFLDISELRGDSIEQDLEERDFTINAIAYDLSNDKIIDCTGGIRDIESRTLRHIKEQNYIDDPLRILRAYRFMSTTGFDIDNNLSEILKKNSELLKLPAKERIHDEIMKLFGGKYTSEALLKMYEDDILEIIFPCVCEIKKIPPNTHHHLDLIHHVIETVRQIEIQYCNECDEVKEHMDTTDFGGYPRMNHLKLAGFLHDIGKPSTWTLEKDGKTIWSIKDNSPIPDDKGCRHRFIKHDIEGSKIVVPLLKKLKFSNKQIEYISLMIKNHIYPSGVISSPVLDEKVMMRYIRKMENNVIDNILLAKADRLSAQGVDVSKEMTENNINGLTKLLQFYIKIKPTLKPLPKLIDGKEIMKILNIEQSPKLGVMIKALHEAQINGDVLTKEEAIDFLKSVL
ncbi:CCA tRNA nucleotidyltransferase [bacterium]|nr:CCA tRNA nucleotidyltransferase [bacterium]